MRSVARMGCHLRQGTRLLGGAFLFGALLFCLSGQSRGDPRPSDFPSSLEVGPSLATFTFTIPREGCVRVLATREGRRETDRLWGPVWLASGTHSVAVDAGRVASRTGLVEWFQITLVPRQTFGRSGRGERQFIRPMGLGWDHGRRELYVADTGNDRIVRMAADGRFIAQYGGFGLALGDRAEEREDSLSGPWDVVPDGFSSFYVSDQNNDRLCEFDIYRGFRGAFYPREGGLRSRLGRPRGVTIDHEGNVWVVDSRHDRVLKLSPGGTKLLDLGGHGSSPWHLRDPTQVAVDSEGRIYVSDPGHQRISVFDRLGSFLRVITEHLKMPVGVGIDPDGLIAVCDEKTQELSLYTPDGFRVFVCRGISGDDPFRSPSDVVVTPHAVYLLDSGNHRVVLLERRKDALESHWHAKPEVLE